MSHAAETFLPNVISRTKWFLRFKDCPSDSLGLRPYGIGYNGRSEFRMWWKPFLKLPSTTQYHYTFVSSVVSTVRPACKVHGFGRRLRANGKIGNKEQRGMHAITDSPRSGKHDGKFLRKSQRWYRKLETMRKNELEQHFGKVLCAPRSHVGEGRDIFFDLGIHCDIILW